MISVSCLAKSIFQAVHESMIILNGCELHIMLQDFCCQDACACTCENAHSQCQTWSILWTAVWGLVSSSDYPNRRSTSLCHFSLYHIRQGKALRAYKAANDLVFCYGSCINKNQRTLVAHTWIWHRQNSYRIRLGITTCWNVTDAQTWLVIIVAFPPNSNNIPSKFEGLMRACLMLK